MRVKRAKILIISLILALSMAGHAFGASVFPFGLELDTEEVERLCFAGHLETVRYREGIAVLPDTCFSITDQGSSSYGYDIDSLSAVIGLQYEKEDGSGSAAEILRTYAPGSLSTGDYYPLLSDNIIANLEERGLLYSDALRSLYITLKCPGREARARTIYLYVCEEDEFFDYLEEP